ncbi:hypothetical protein BDW71DRAFT_35990 [Aspergillus fruticulosus]
MRASICFFVGAWVAGANVLRSNCGLLGFCLLCQGRGYLCTILGADGIVTCLNTVNQSNPGVSYLGYLYYYVRLLIVWSSLYWDSCKGGLDAYFNQWWTGHPI